MRTNIRLGRVLGIEIGLHYSWFLIALLIVFTLSDYFHASNPAWTPAVVFAISGLTGIFFFVSIVVHELSHSVVASARGLPVRSITLFALGGVAQIEKGAGSARTEFLMAIAGPIASAVIGVCALAISVLCGWSPATEQFSSPWLAALVWLGFINVGLAVFNLIPGYPMDGGRILRSLIWWKTGNAERSTQIAARVGQATGVAFIAIGVARLWLGAGFGSLWTAFIGWFIIRAAAASYEEARLRGAMQGVHVRDIMSRDCPAIDRYTNLQSLAGMLRAEGPACFVIEEQGEPVGIITSNELEHIERQRWPYTTVDDVMRPLEELQSISPDALLADALEIMARADTPQLPVISGGHLEGILSYRQVARFFRTHPAARAS